MPSGRHAIGQTVWKQGATTRWTSGTIAGADVEGFYVAPSRPGAFTQEGDSGSVYLVQTQNQRFFPFALHFSRIFEGPNRGYSVGLSSPPVPARLEQQIGTSLTLCADEPPRS